MNYSTNPSYGSDSSLAAPPPARAHTESPTPRAARPVAPDAVALGGYEAPLASVAVCPLLAAVAHAILPADRRLHESNPVSRSLRALADGSHRDYDLWRASGGTTPTLTIDVMETGVSVLSAPISVTAGTVSEGTITDTELADESVITINTAITGTSPTWDDIVVQLNMIRHT